MKKLLGMVLLALFAVGCNTVEGMGKDISKAGETIENAATKKKCGPRASFVRAPPGEAHASFRSAQREAR